MKCEFYARAKVNPTEDLDKVIKALSNIFDYDEIEIGDDYVCVSGGRKSLIMLRDSLIKRKIRSTARSIMIKGISNHEINFNLSKQSAFAGIPNFVEEELSPLGEIAVKINTDDVEKVIDWIAPDVSQILENS
jgi:predicted RNA binding protein with dsRBD fold (UPF0201 family)